MSDVEHTTEVVDDQETDQVLQQVKFKKQKQKKIINNSQNIMKISHEMLKVCTNFRHSFFNQHDKINVTV